MNTAHRLITAALFLSFTQVAGAQATVLGKWRAVSAEQQSYVGTIIEIRRNGTGYEILADGEVFGGFVGNDGQISQRFVFSWDRLKRDFDRAPDEVLRQILGTAFRDLTLTAQNDARTLVEMNSVGNVKWTGKRFDGWDPYYRWRRTVYERIGDPPTASGLRVGNGGTGVFSCYRTDATKSGCVDVRNNSTRRVRMYLDQLPGVQCTVEAGSYCSVPIAIGTYNVRLQADDDQGVGPTVQTAIELTSDGIRLLLEGDLR